MVDKERAKAEVEWQRGRRVHVDPVHAALVPTLWTTIGLALLGAIGVDFVSFWMLLLIGTAVFGSVWSFTRMINDSMESEIDRRVRR